jgi:hypothetical protein
LKNKNRVGGLILPYLNTYYKAVILKIVYYWHNDNSLSVE